MSFESYALPTPSAAPPPVPPPDAGRPGRFSTPVVLAFQVLATVAAMAGAGAIAGRIWFHLWNEPTGVVQQGQWFTDETGLRADFAGTGLYLVIALITGAVVGLLVGLVFDRAEVVTLVAVAAGALLGAYVMWKVGIHRSPPDPAVLARTAKDGTKLPGQLALARRTPLVAFPLGAVVVYAAVLLVVPGRRRDVADSA